MNEPLCWCPDCKVYQIRNTCCVCGKDIKPEPESLRTKMLANLQKEMEEQLFLAAENGHIGIAALGGNRRKMVELQMEWLRNCAQNWQNPAAFMLHWMRMLVTGLLVYENLIEMQEAIKDSTEINQDKPDEHEH